MPQECSNYKEKGKYAVYTSPVHARCTWWPYNNQWLHSCFCSPRLAVAVKELESALVCLWLHHSQSFLEMSLTDLLCCNVLMHGTQSCPQNSTNCTKLSEYTEQTELYFTSDTTTVFLLAAHTLDTDVTVANVTRLTMQRVIFKQLSNNCLQ